jgi:hypothetical protein
MQEAWDGFSTQEARDAHLECARKINASSLREFKSSIGYTYSVMRGLVESLATMIIRSKDSRAYHNWVQRLDVRCSCDYDTEEKTCEITFSIVHQTHMNWYWKKNVTSINSLKRRNRAVIMNIVNGA